MSFSPIFSITNETALNLMRIESARQAASTLPMNEQVLAGLRQSARLVSTHYSTQIEGNRLTQAEVDEVLLNGIHLQQRKRDELEIRGYFSALEYAETFAADHKRITEVFIKKLHALLMGGGSTRRKPTGYREGQNVIREAGSRRIVYMPPEASDVPLLMKELTLWINQNKTSSPIPIIAAIAHYQFATIHPYYDGNGRTARLLTNSVLHQNGYGLNGIYNLEEYYARNLQDYYDALDTGGSHNYYMGRAEADITRWVTYFTSGMADSFEAVRNQMQAAAQSSDQSRLVRSLDARQREVLQLFNDWEEITSSQIATLLSLSPRGARALAQKWVEAGFLQTGNPSKRGRTYRLAPQG